MSLEWGTFVNEQNAIQEIDGKLTIFDIEEDKTYANILYPIFTIENLPPEVKYYQIVRCKRTRDDRTVLDAGVAGYLRTVPTTTRRIFGIRTSLDVHSQGANSAVRDLLEYSSPEILFNKENIQESDRIDFIGTLIATNAIVTGFSPFTYLAFVVNPAYIYYHQTEHHPTTTNVAIGEIPYSIPLQEKLFRLTDSQDSIVDISGYNVYNRAAANISNLTTNVNHKGTNLLIKLSEDVQMIIGIPSVTTSTLPVYIYRRKLLYPYGGASYVNRLTRSYIACSDVVDSSEPSSEIHVFNGDTFINLFDYLRIVWSPEEDVDDRRTHSEIYITETMINLPLRLDDHLNRLYISGQSGAELYKYAMREEAGVHFFASSFSYLQEGDLYRYNTVYSRQDDSKIYIPKPFDFDELTNRLFDTRVINSDKKVNGELADSWTRFRFNNAIDVDTKYGAITRLKNFMNNLVFFQPDGIGILSVEDREVIPSTTVGSLVLGTGDVLQRYDYISTMDGCSDRDSIVETKTGLYFYDKRRSTFNQMTGQVAQISKILGMQSWFSSRVGIYNDVIGVYNGRYNEVFMSSEHIDTSIIIKSVSTPDGDGNYSVVIEIPDKSLKELKLQIGTKIKIDGTTLSAFFTFDDWFLPSADELTEMYTELHLQGVGDFSSAVYWCSTEINATSVRARSFSAGSEGATNKANNSRVRACRSFAGTAIDYPLRSTGPAGGLIFAHSGGLVYEAATSPDQSNSSQWSNLTSTLIGVTAQGTAIGTGKTNTEAIITQVGHTQSAALSCDEFIRIFPEVTDLEATVTNIDYTAETVTMQTSSSDILFLEEDQEISGWVIMTGFTVVFSEAINAFTEFLGFVPRAYIKTPNNVISLNYFEDAEDTHSHFYVHDAGLYAKYYDQDPNTSKLVVVVNPSNTTMCRFDVVEFVTEVLNNNADIFETFSRIRVYNSYQDTEVIELTPDDNIKRRMRTWRINRLRDRVSAQPRLKDYYIIIELEFDNDGTESIRISDITTVFTPLRMH